VASPGHRQGTQCVAPWRILKVGIRMYETWPWVLDHLINTDLLTPELLSDYAVAVHRHGEALAAVASALTPGADHNTYTMGAWGTLGRMR